MMSNKKLMGFSRSNLSRLIVDRKSASLSILLISFGVVSITISSASHISGQYIYPHFFLSSVFIISSLIYLCTNYGLISVPAIFGGIIGYPLLVPFINRFVFNFPNFTHAGTYEGTGLTNMIVFHGAVFMIFYTFFLMMFKHEFKTSGLEKTYYNINIYFHKYAFASLIALYLMSAYLYAPGPTILTADYVTILNNRGGWSDFAAAIYKGAWAVLFLMVVGRNYSKKRYRLFILATLIGVTWMLLHGRRVESIGFFLTIAVHLSLKHTTSGQTNTIRSRFIKLSPLLLIPIMIIVNFLRNAGSFSESQPIKDLIGTGFFSFPSGAHGIYHTQQITFDQFQNGGYLLGKTFLNYIPQSIPTLFYYLLPVEYPVLYHFSILDKVPTYLGGNHFMNVYYANFGTPGIIIAAIVLAIITAFCHQKISLDIEPTLVTGVAVVLFLNGFRSLWYTQLNWIPTLQGFSIALVIYILVSNASIGANRLS